MSSFEEGREQVAEFQAGDFSAKAFESVEQEQDEGAPAYEVGFGSRERGPLQLDSKGVTGATIRIRGAAALRAAADAFGAAADSAEAI